MLDVEPSRAISSSSLMSPRVCLTSGCSRSSADLAEGPAFQEGDLALCHIAARHALQLPRRIAVDGLVAARLDQLVLLGQARHPDETRLPDRHAGRVQRACDRAQAAAGSTTKSILSALSCMGRCINARRRQRPPRRPAPGAAGTTGNKNRSLLHKFRKFNGSRAGPTLEIGTEWYATRATRPWTARGWPRTAPKTAIIGSLKMRCGPILRGPPPDTPPCTISSFDSVQRRRLRRLRPLDDFLVIFASGADALTFLHGQLTQDVTGLPADAARLAGYCTARAGCWPRC